MHKQQNDQERDSHDRGRADKRDMVSHVALIDGVCAGGEHRPKRSKTYDKRSADRGTNLHERAGNGIAMLNFVVGK